MYEQCATLARGFGHDARRFTVHQARVVGIRFGGIHGRVGGSIYDQFGACIENECTQFRQVTQIEFG